MSPVALPLPLPRGRSLVGRRAMLAATRPVYRLLALKALLIVALVAALGFAVDGRDFAVMLPLIAGAVALAWAMRWCRLARPADALEAGAVILASSMATGCLSVLLAAWGPPLRDADLARVDALLFPFLSWPAMAGALAHWPGLIGAMQRIYLTLLWQPFALAALLAATGRRQVLWRFVHAWLLALIACLAVFALVPAVSAQVHYGLGPGRVDGLTIGATRPARLILDLRSGALRTLASGSMAGLVTFPSFHAAGATLLGWGFWRAGKVGWPMVALNLLMIPAIPLVGSHYFVDVAAGVALAALVIRAAPPGARAAQPASPAAVEPG